MTDRSQIRVLQIIDTLSMGGAETWLMEALRLWSRNDEVQMDFLMTSGNRGIFDEEARRLGATLHYLRYTRRRLLSFANGFRRILRNGQYDVIHDHQDYAAGWHFLMGGRSLPKIRVVHVHNPSFGIRHIQGVSVSRRVVAAAGKYFVSRYANRITGTSRQIISEFGFDTPLFHDVPKAALHCGFDPDRFSGDVGASKTSLCAEFGWSKDSKILLFAGRMDESPDLGHSKNHKNSGFAVDIAIASMKQDPHMRAIFAGNTSVALPILEQRVADAGLTKRFSFAGVLTDIERVMLGADVLLFPSRGEGLGMVAVEAQASGLPVLASTAVPRECVVIPELVEFRDIGVGSASWSDDVLRLANLPRDVESANRRVAESPFAIKNSTQCLAELYRTGSLAVANCRPHRVRTNAI